MNLCHKCNPQQSWSKMCSVWHWKDSHSNASSAPKRSSFTTPCCNMAGFWLNLAAVTRRHSVQYAFVTKTIKKRAGWALILFNCCRFRITCAVECYPICSLMLCFGAGLRNLLTWYKDSAKTRTWDINQPSLCPAGRVQACGVADALGCCAFRWFRAILHHRNRDQPASDHGSKRVADRLKSLATWRQHSVVRNR